VAHSKVGVLVLACVVMKVLDGGQHHPTIKFSPYVHLAFSKVCSKINYDALLLA